jgi:hypothetical protein
MNHFRGEMSEDIFACYFHVKFQRFEKKKYFFSTVCQRKFSFAQNFTEFLAYFQYAYVRALSVRLSVSLLLSMGLADLARLWLDR